MTDLLFVALTVAFFGLCVGYVRACDRIVASGPEPADELDSEAGQEPAVSQR
ncbi:MAG TPA: hypothetical protein VEX15_16270 [Nocardioidaceae bacterium]|nr:hypothetical protein [Nocardioidaceae bacterium]